MENHTKHKLGVPHSENGNGRAEKLSDGKHDGDRKLRVIIIGGSITGLSSAHALLRAGVCSSVTVLEKARKLTSAGAGLNLDHLACQALEEWGLHDDLLRNALPIDSEENRAVDIEAGICLSISKDEQWNKQAVHWNDLHRILYNSLPSRIVHFGHEVVSVEENEDPSSIRVTVSIIPGVEGNNAPVTTKEFHADVVVAADGSMSRTRKLYLPKEERRYSGYCAMRGVLDYTDEQGLYNALKEAYPHLGKSTYFDLAQGTHMVLYELTEKRVNWLWYMNQPEPELKGNSVTKYLDAEAMAELHRAADRTWTPALVKLMKRTPKPFINAIYDRDPLQQFVWGRVVLVGDAAHPTTPHAVRSTNGSIVDAYALGKAFEKWGSGNVSAALAAYESERLPLTSLHLLFSRHLGQVKQGLLFEPKGSFPWPTASARMREALLIRNMNSFHWRNCPQNAQERIPS